MGKNNRPYDGPRMNYTQKQGYLRQIGKDRYDINEYDTKYVDDEGNDTDGNRDADILKAMNNDYSFRDAQKYGQEAGMKGFAGSGKGFTNTHDAYNTHRAIVRHGTEEMDHKNVSSDQDYANISHDLFKRSRSNFAEQFATKDDLNKQQDVQKAQTETSTEPVELSARAKSALGDYSFEAPKTESAFQGNSEEPELAYDPNKGVKSKEAGSFMNNYKLNLQNKTS